MLQFSWKGKMSKVFSDFFPKIIEKSIEIINKAESFVNLESILGE